MGQPNKTYIHMVEEAGQKWFHVGPEPGWCEDEAYALEDLPDFFRNHNGEIIVWQTDEEYFAACEEQAKANREAAARFRATHDANGHPHGVPY